LNQLKSKLVKGGFWIFLERVNNVFVSVVKITVLTHFLLPTEFGIFGVALISFDILTHLSRSGFRQALIQKRGDVSSYLNSAWTLTFLRYFIISVLLYAIAPIAAQFFNNTEAIGAIRAFSLVIIVHAFVNIADVYLQKELNFRTHFFYTSGGLAADLILSILFAIILKNFWALYIGYFARISFRLVFSYLLFSFRPKFEFNLVKVQELFRFGKWILGASILGAMSMYLDNIFVGKLVGITALGLYQVAFKFSHIGSGELYTIMSRLYFPYFSEIQYDAEESKATYLNLLKLNAIFMLLFTTGMLCLAPAFTNLFLDSEWISIIPVIQILVCASLLNSIKSSANPFLKGRGDPQFVLLLQSIKVVFLVIFITLFSSTMGITGIALSVVFAEFVALLVWFIILSKIIRGFFYQFIKIAYPPVIAATFMAISILLFIGFPGGNRAEVGLIQFFISGIMGVAIYFIVIFLYTKISPKYGDGIHIRNLYYEIINK